MLTRGKKMTDIERLQLLQLKITKVERRITLNPFLNHQGRFCNGISYMASQCRRLIQEEIDILVGDQMTNDE